MFNHEKTTTIFPGLFNNLFNDLHSCLLIKHGQHTILLFLTEIEYAKYAIHHRQGVIGIYEYASINLFIDKL